MANSERYILVVVSDLFIKAKFICWHCMVSADIECMLLVNAAVCQILANTLSIFLSTVYLSLPQ